jgi:hypothetical protein
MNYMEREDDLYCELVAVFRFYCIKRWTAFRDQK